MEKFIKWEFIGKVFISIFFFSIHTSFLESLLNPQLSIKTSVFLVLILKNLFLGFLFFGLILYFLFIKFPKYSNFILVLFCFLVVGNYYIEKQIHPLFFDPLLYKLTKKGLWAGGVSFIGIILLKNYKRALFLLLIASSFFLYQKRDAIKFKAPLRVPLEVNLAEIPRTYFLIFETEKDENFIEKIKEDPKWNFFNKFLDEGTRGIFKIPNYIKEDILLDTIFTGTYPYLHRNFGKNSNVFFPIYNIDLEPFFFPKIFKKEKREGVPYLWDILKQLKVPYKVKGIFNNVSFQKKRAFFNIYYNNKLMDENFLKRKIENKLKDLKEGDLFLILIPQKSFFYIKGDNVKKGQLITSMKIVDILPTVMYLSNFPLSYYFSGRVLSEGIEEEFLSKNPFVTIGKY